MQEQTTTPTSGPASARRLPDPVPCDARRCAHCRFRSEETGAVRVRPLTIDDLRWFFESESALGVRSTHGAFVAMAESGIMTGGGSNGVEDHAVEHRRLRSVGRHNCILRRLRGAGLSAHHLAVLAAALGPEDWTRTLETVDRETVRAALPPDLWQLAPLTSKAIAHAGRRTPREEPCASVGEALTRADVLFDGGWEELAPGDIVLHGVRCAYKPAPTPPKKVKRESATPSEHPEDQKEKKRARAAFLSSARGAVVLACRDGDRRVLDRMVTEARHMLDLALHAVGARTRKRSAGVRATTKPEGKRQKTAAPIEPRSDAEALCG